MTRRKQVRVLGMRTASDYSTKEKEYCSPFTSASVRSPEVAAKRQKCGIGDVGKVFITRSVASVKKKRKENEVQERNH